MNGPPLSSRILIGLGLLARCDSRAFQMFGETRQAAAFSFIAPILLAPFFLLATFYNLGFAGGLPEEALRLTGAAFFIVNLMHYVLNWTLMPVAMDGVTRLLRRRDSYYRWLAAYNWANLAMWVLTLTLYVLLELSNNWDSAVAQVIWAALTCASLFYAGVVARLGLRVPISTAVLVVMIDLFLSMLSYVALYAMVVI